MKAILVVLFLAMYPTQLIRADEKQEEEIRKVATAIFKAQAERDFEGVYDHWSERLKLSNTWEAFFEANFAIDNDQRWKGDAKKLLSELYDKDAAEKARELALKKDPQLPEDDELKIILSHVSDHRKLWVEWMKVMSKDAPAPARAPTSHDFGKSTIELMKGFAKLTDGDIQAYFKKEDDGWKFTVKEIEPDLRKIEKVEQGGARRPATAPESKPEGKEKPKTESKGRSQ